ncbi:MAG: helix-turn-helix transcriptional regulator [Oscillospiraceae bacterium]|jgi:DNA-binding transcriptional ArsR family regulator|nr:helix-turn-helix transcriptional regulator [Oscillospiraceae bacterium]MCI9288791.1 helix-turn-helix transcriptional regulator [Oscillospiraceae bacterium]MCI9550071.1 helix-turn-helix transcriptional regulator [Oscillospiraceae bacterium]
MTDHNEIERCGCLFVHEDAVSEVLGEMPDDETLYDLAELFKVFGDSTRIKILYALFEAELCVCDISKLLGLTQSAVSHQLRVLKNSRLVKFRREGKTVFYALADGHVRRIIAQGMDHIKE